MSAGPWPRVDSPNLSAADLRRFWSKVEKTESCWIWRGPVSKSGYGNFLAQGRQLKPHRVSFFLFHGYWPARLVCHHCDQPLCLRGDHLHEGSPRDNMNDRDARGRQACGERNGKAKLTSAVVVAIRTRVAAGEMRANIARELRLGWSTVNDIVNWRVWT